MPQVAVIVLSYNSLEETTKPCLESIFAAQTDADFEVLVVDNASTDNTREYLQQLQARQGNLKLIFNRENKGFPAGNNVGIRAAEADFYVLLNSDTRVTDYWLDKMLAFAGACRGRLAGAGHKHRRQRASNLSAGRRSAGRYSIGQPACLRPGRQLVLHLLAGFFLRDDPQRGFPDDRSF